MRAIPRARELDQPRLVDHIPELLDRIALMTEDLARGSSPNLETSVAEQHALERLEEGFDILEVIGEFRVLRHSILQTFSDPGLGMVHVDEIRVLDDAIDTAITESVDRYSQVRERTLQGLDRVASAALESHNLDDLLMRLLRVLHETTPAIDASSIYLREGDMLRVRAAVGMEREVEDGFSMRIGDGFAGTVAARNEPLTVHRPTADQVRSPALVRSNVRVLYGVPIVAGDDVIGVAKIGSFTAEDFSLQDRRIFAAMVARASAAILQHVLREQAEQAAARLAESDAQFRALADHIPQLAWMADASGRIYWVNRRWYDYTGTTPDDLHGNGWERVQHPDHLARVTARFQRAIATGVPWEDTFPMRGKDGHFRWFLSRAVPIRDETGRLERWFGTNTDVSARRFLDDATKVLNRSLDYRQTLEELAHLAVPELADFCIVDLLEDGKLEHVTMVHGDEQKLQLAREFIAHNPYDPARHVGTRQIMERGQPMLVSEINNEMLLARTHSAERQIRQMLGFRSWIGAPLVARNQTIGVIHLMLSESSRRYSEADVEVVAELGRRAGAAVDNARLYRDAQEAIRVRDDVLAIVSHDLRNPLAAVDLGATLLLQRFGSDARARKHLEMIRRSAIRMEHLIGDLLDMASINAGKLALQPVRIDAGEVIAEVVDMHEPVAAERGITLVRENDLTGVPLLVDRNRIFQVFANLIGNALKFCKPGDVIAVRGERADDRVRLVVSDTGPGIARLDLPHIFEPYWSGRRGRKQGAGLGLFITRAIVEAHGGAIDVVSEEGRGSTFTVTLPVAR